MSLNFNLEILKLSHLRDAEVMIFITWNQDDVEGLE